MSVICLPVCAQNTLDRPRDATCDLVPLCQYIPVPSMLWMLADHSLTDGKTCMYVWTAYLALSSLPRQANL